MDRKSLEVLDFQVILRMLAEKTSLESSRQTALSLVPAESVEKVKHLQQETREAVWVQTRVFTSASPMSGIRDVSPLLDKAFDGAILEPAELLDVAYTLEAALSLRDTLSKHESEVPLLFGYARSIGSFPEFTSEVRRCISDDAKVRDDASLNLKRIRDRLKGLSARLREKIDSLLRQEDVCALLQEPIVTIRDGRYVLPVKREYRHRLPGIVHDASSSGATVFIEPSALVEISNEMKELEAAEREEIRSILRGLTSLFVRRSEEMKETLGALSRLDFAFAKGRLADEMNGRPPMISDMPSIRLIRAIHPLLGKGAKPIDVRLGYDFDILVITGPNTGGKTVALRTVGLLCAMAQSGLFIPAAEGSEVGVFQKIFADIGDEQSIEQSLSTFSSHMRNIIEVINNADNGTLALLDELGAGTDPAEGSAIAMAVLEHLLDRGTKCIVTTHSGELKLFAFQKEKVQNARVEFDPVTLEPTFELSIDLPGRSNALEISRRLGLTESVLHRAVSFMSEGGIRVEDAIVSLEAERKAFLESLSKLETEREEIRKLKDELEKKLLALRRDRAKVLEKASRDARALVHDARRELNAVLKQAKDLRSKLESLLADVENCKAATAAADGGPAIRDGVSASIREALASAGREVEVLRSRLRGIEGDVEKAAPVADGLKRGAGGVMYDGVALGALENEEGLPFRPGGRSLEAVLDPGELRPGERVVVCSLGREGRVVNEPDPTGNVIVQMDDMRVKVKVGGILRIKEVEKEVRGDQTLGWGTAAKETRAAEVNAKTKIGEGLFRKALGRDETVSLTRNKMATVSPEIDVRGLLAAEAIERLDKYLDDALLCGLDQVRIIHGKGTGALRKAVREFLQNHHQVASLRWGDPNEGGDGVTVVKLGNSAS
ncbi:MAG TPA: endonuclease MutS2 [Clostridia bacterium]|nr:endonuclease MutS2 [Clostridia bacterium]